jgi:hypothetical protein
MAYPSVGRIAQETEFAESTVREALAWLRENEIVSQMLPPSQHRAATYRVNLEKLSDLQVVEVYQAAARPPAPGARPPAGGPEPSLTVNEPLGGDGIFQDLASLGIDVGTAKQLIKQYPAEKLQRYVNWAILGAKISNLHSPVGWLKWALRTDAAPPRGVHVEKARDYVAGYEDAVEH